MEIRSPISLFVMLPALTYCMSSYSSMLFVYRVAMHSSLLAWGVILVVTLFRHLADDRGPSGICVYRTRGKGPLGTSSFPQVACDCSKSILLSVL